MKLDDFKALPPFQEEVVCLLNELIREIKDLRREINTTPDNP